MVLEKECDKYSAWCPISPATPLHCSPQRERAWHPRRRRSRPLASRRTLPCFSLENKVRGLKWIGSANSLTVATGSAWSLVQQEDSGTSSVAPLSSRTCGIVANELSGGAVTYCTGGCTSLVILDLKDSEAKQAAEGAQGVVRCVVKRFVREVPLIPSTCPCRRERRGREGLVEHPWTCLRCLVGGVRRSCIQGCDREVRTDRRRRRLSRYVAKSSIL